VKLDEKYLKDILKKYENMKRRTISTLLNISNTKLLGSSETTISNFLNSTKLVKKTLDINKFFLTYYETNNFSYWIM